MTNQSYYDILGVSKTATADEIKRAYRKLARQYHPDVNKSADAEVRMKEINVAYEVLSDPQKRADYDRFGNAYSQQGYQQTYQNQQYYQQYTSMDDLFRQMFGQQYQNQYQNQNQGYQRRYYYYGTPVQSSFIGRLFKFIYIFMMIRFLIRLFLPFLYF